MKPRIFLILTFGILIINSIPYLSGPSILKSITDYWRFTSLFGWIICFYLFGIGLVLLGLSLFIKKLKSLRKFISILLFSVVVYFTSFLILPNIFKEINRPKEIKIASEIIESIFRYKLNNGDYPESLNDLVPQYMDLVKQPKTISIKSFIYLKNKDNFNLYFIQTTIPGLAIERVIYSPSRDKIMGKIMYTPILTNYKDWYIVKED